MIKGFGGGEECRGEVEESWARDTEDKLKGPAVSTVTLSICGSS